MRSQTRSAALAAAVWACALGACALALVASERGLAHRAAPVALSDPLDGSAIDDGGASISSPDEPSSGGGDYVAMGDGDDSFRPHIATGRVFDVLQQVGADAAGCARGVRRLPRSLPAIARSLPSSSLPPSSAPPLARGALRRAYTLHRYLSLPGRHAQLVHQTAIDGNTRVAGLADSRAHEEQKLRVSCFPEMSAVS
jgi:hypothetical protein